MQDFPLFRIQFTDQGGDLRSEIHQGGFRLRIASLDTNRDTRRGNGFLTGERLNGIKYSVSCKPVSKLCNGNRTGSMNNNS
jgi:hypothetical protein